ncbi:MAG TPA: phosphate ABC transporter permease PstA [Armatimonadota bacterium]|jgi:phosphate transport system permease protein
MNAKRRIFDFLFRLVSGLATLIIAALLAAILWSVTEKGFRTVDWEFVSKVSEGDFYLGGAGGIADAIWGSFYLGVGATFLALLMSIPTVLYMRVYADGSRFADFIRSSLDVLQGVPSIVFGIFGFLIMVKLHLKASLLAAIITVALLELPILVRAIDEVARIVPRELDDTAYVLGSTKFEAAFRVIIKQILPGVATASLLAFGRGVGDAAAVLFTAGFTSGITLDPRQQVPTLPLEIFNLYNSPVEAVQNKAYGAALVLVILVLSVSIVSRVLSARLSKHVIN